MKIQIRKFNDLISEIFKANYIGVAGSGGKSSFIALCADFAKKNNIPLCISTTTKVSSDEFNDYQKIRGTYLKIKEILKKSKPISPFFISKSLAIEKNKEIGFSIETLDKLKLLLDTKIIYECDGSRRLPLKACNSKEPCVSKLTDLFIVFAGLSGLDKPLDYNTVFRPELFSQYSGIKIGDKIDLKGIIKSASYKENFLTEVSGNCNKILILNQADTVINPKEHINNINLNNIPYNSVYLTELPQVKRVQ